MAYTDHHTARERNNLRSLPGKDETVAKVRNQFSPHTEKYNELGVQDLNEVVPISDFRKNCKLNLNFLLQIIGT
jgi:hypothetical protein